MSQKVIDIASSLEFINDYNSVGTSSNSRISASSNGDLTFFSTNASINSSTGTIILRNGGISVGCTVNATSITAGGSLTIAGGASVNQTMFVGCGISSPHNTNTIGSIYTTGGNVGVNLINPSYTFDVNGSFRTQSDSTQSIFTSNNTSNVISLNNKHSEGYSEIMFLNSADIQKCSIGYGNVGSNALYAGTAYFKSASGVPIKVIAGNNTSNPLQINANDNSLSITSTSNAVDTSSGSLQVSGGASFVKDVFIGGRLECNNFSIDSLNIVNMSSSNLISTNVSAASVTITESFLVTGSGKVGIRNTNPNYALDVDGDVFASGNIIGFSDMRIKTDIVTIQSALEKVNKLRGVYFTHKHTKVRGVGVIAQEIQNVLPEVVIDNRDDGYLGVAYGNVIGLLIEAIKDLSKENKELRKQVQLLWDDCPGQS